MASLMIEGIVTSLKILVIGMGYRGSKSIIIKLIIVKEQRVDGSSAFSKNGCCKVYSSRRESRFLKNKSFYSDFYILTVNSSFIKNNNLIKSQIRSLHNKSDLNPWFVTGLIDAEWCFHLGLTANDKYKQNYQVTLKFSMSLHEKDKDLLIKLKNYFGVGSIVNHGPTTLQYRITSIKDISTLISHCNNFPLTSQKRIDYELFKKAYNLIIDKLHLTNDGFKEILSIRASMNLGLTDKLALANPKILAIEKPIIKDLKVQDPNWISGFTTGDGCFHVTLAKSPFTKTGYRVALRFQLAQHNRDIKLMKSLITYLGCGRVEENLKTSMSYFVINKFSDIIDIVIPFFDKYPIHGVNH